jgi:NADPH-dependent glutamate synthase beta subunit-like oxidoreductase
MEENPLPATHGRACYHPVKAPQPGLPRSGRQIHSLDRFLGDRANERAGRSPGAPTGKRVLVVGAGRRLSCAYAADASARGRNPRRQLGTGRMMHYGIPAYRLPRGWTGISASSRWA